MILQFCKTAFLATDCILNQRLIRRVWNWWRYHLCWCKSPCCQILSLGKWDRHTGLHHLQQSWERWQVLFQQEYWWPRLTKQQSRQSKMISKNDIFVSRCLGKSASKRIWNSISNHEFPFLQGPQYKPQPIFHNSKAIRLEYHLFNCQASQALFD